MSKEKRNSLLAAILIVIIIAFPCSYTAGDDPEDFKSHFVIQSPAGEIYHYYCNGHLLSETRSVQKLVLIDCSTCKEKIFYLGPGWQWEIE